MEADLGSTLSSAFDSVVPPDASAEQAAPAAEESGVVAETPAPTEQTAPTGAAPTDPAAPADTSYQLTPDGTGYVVPKAEFPLLSGAKQYAEKVQERFPTIQDAEVAYLQSSDHNAMMTDFLHGETADVDAMLSHLAGANATDPQFRSQSQQAFTRMAERLPEVLKQVNPEAYAKHVNNMFQVEVQAAYEKAAQTGDPKDLLRAQSIEWGKTGRYQIELPKVDPAKAASDAQAAREASIAQRETQLLDRDWSNFNRGTVEGPKWQQFNAAIDAALAPVKAKYTPEIFSAVRDRIASQINDKLKADFDWARMHGNERKVIEASYKQAWKSNQSVDGLNPRIQAYNNDFMARVRRHLPSIAAPILNSATASAVASQKAPQPAAPPNQPAARAANGQFQAQTPQTGRSYDFSEDPEWQAAFRVN